MHQGYSLKVETPFDLANLEEAFKSARYTETLLANTAILICLRVRIDFIIDTDECVLI